MQKRTLLVLLVSLAFVSACSNITATMKSEGYVQMSGRDIRTALVGNTLSGTDSDGDYIIYYPNASQMRIAYQGRKESGVWRIEGDKYCRQWKSFGNGKERCVTMYIKEDRIDWVQKGEITDRSILLKGNPKGL